MNTKQINEHWSKKEGAAQFDFENRDIILYDGGLFSVKKIVKKVPRTRWKKVKEGKLKGSISIVEIKGPKVEREDYEATLWFEELDETINYFKRMKKLLNKNGWKTTGKVKCR